MSGFKSSTSVTSGGRLWIWWWIFGFCTGWAICNTVERLLTLKKGTYSMNLFSRCTDIYWKPCSRCTDIYWKPCSSCTDIYWKPCSSCTDIYWKPCCSSGTVWSKKFGPEWYCQMLIPFHVHWYMFGQLYGGRMKDKVTVVFCQSSSHIVYWNRKLLSSQECWTIQSNAQYEYILLNYYIFLSVYLPVPVAARSKA